MSKPPIAKRELLVPEKHYEYMLAKAKDQEFKDLLTTCWEVGPRLQEVVAVEARHVDLERGLWIFPVEESKGKKLQRVVYLSDTVIEICKRLCEENPEGPIYRNTEGNPWDGLSTSCRFRRFKGKKHLGVKYHVYAFRHTFATRCLQVGIDSVTLAVLMGHVDASMISRVYQHLAHDPGQLRDVLKKLKPAQTASGFQPPVA
jgi:integrase